MKTNFLVAEPVCTGENGALQRPYRATARTWGLTIMPDDAGLAQQVDLAVLGAHRAELIAEFEDEPDGEPLSYLWSLAAQAQLDLDPRDSGGADPN